MSSASQGQDSLFERSSSAPSVAHESDATVIWLSGEQDWSTFPALHTLLMAEADARDIDIVVDLSQVTFMDGSTVGGLLRCKHLLQTRGQWLTLRSPTQATRRILEICDLGVSARRRPAAWN